MSSLNQDNAREVSSAGQVKLSTDDLDGRRRLDIWREAYSRHLFNLDIEALGDEPFRADVALRALPGASVVYGTRSASRTSISRPLLQTASDNLVLAITTKGRSLAKQVDREEEIGPGGAILFSTAELASHTLVDDGELLSISFPKASIEPYVGDVGSALMRAFAPRSDTLRLLTHYAKGALALDEDASPELAAKVATHLRDLVTMLLGARHDAQELITERGMGAARLRAIKSEILAQLGHGELSADLVAQKVGISGNYVRKLIQHEGVSFSEYVHGLRLERAFAMLQDRRLAHHTIAAIALSAGFNDISYFNRSFRSRYGMTPSDARGRTTRLGEAGVN